MHFSVFLKDWLLIQTETSGLKLILLVMDLVFVECKLFLRIRTLIVLNLREN